MQEQSFTNISGTFNTFFLITDFFKFWFLQAPIGLIKFFLSFNGAFLKLFSFRILLDTFFKPWKNEYRDGLVGFSIAMGMFFKSIVILTDLLFLSVFIVFEITFILAFVLWPIITFFLIFR